MKKYVFEESRDKVGNGSQTIFNSEAEAIKHADDYWLGMVRSDRQSYINDKAPYFMVYEIEITEEQLADYAVGELETPLTELWCRDIKDYLE